MATAWCSRSVGWTRLGPGFPFEQLDVSVEAYDRHTGQKHFENVRLPEGSKVLGGGRYLYVLLNPHIPPWRIAKYELLSL